MKEDQIQFLPFHAINEFMRSDFRVTVLRSALTALPGLPEAQQSSINRLTRKFVKVPGFRNSEKAPVAVKLLPLATAFEKSPELVAAILTAWAEAHSELRLQVFEVLKARGWFQFPDDPAAIANLALPKTEAEWGILPLAADRTRLPGFLLVWPAGQTYEDIYATWTQTYPEAQGSLDEVSLMSVWLAMRLPYQVEGENAEETSGEENAEK